MAGKPQSEVFVLHDHGKLIASVMVGHEGRRAWVYYLERFAKDASDYPLRERIDDGLL